MKVSRAAAMVLSAMLVMVGAARGQDDSLRGEPIVDGIDPAALKYDYLVDGALAQDDPTNHRFKTLQAAYAAAPAGTAERPTVIGIKPDVYLLPGRDSGASLNITKNYITLLGLTNNRRSVVLADNRGHAQGATDNGFVINVNATGFTAKNLTILNYCNTDYAYPGDLSKNLAKRSDVITQAVAFQADGDRLVLENVALLSRLDTMFLRAARSYYRNVFIEGTDDFIGGGQLSVWEDCTITFPEGRGVMSASQIAFIRCRFEAESGLQFYKAEFGGGARPVALIDCVIPVNAPQKPVAWIRGKAASRPNLYSLTYHLTDAAGKPAIVYDSTQETGTSYSRELSDAEAAGFNPWNILRAAPNGAVDDWDPAGVREKYEAMGKGSDVFRMTLSGGNPTVRTGGQPATIGAAIFPGRVADKTITWTTQSELVSLSNKTGPNVVVTAKNDTSEPQVVAINATAANGFYVTANVLVEPRYIDPPRLVAPPAISAAAGGAVHLDYKLDAPGREDQSLITWYACDDAAGAGAREVAVSRGNEPLKTYVLSSGDIGKYLRAGIRPKHEISDPGEQVVVMAGAPVAGSDVTSLDVSPRFQNFVATANNTYVDGRWTVLGTWTIEAGERFVDGYGIRAGSQGASLLYQQDAVAGDMQVELVMTPEKTAGQGFGGPGGPEEGDRIQKSDIYIKYDPRTKNGYALRYWRTTASAEKCTFQLYKIVDGRGSPLNDRQVSSGVFKQNTRMTLKAAGNKLSVTADNDADQETLELEGVIEPNRFGGAGVYWTGTVPRGNSNVYSRIKITYQATK